MMLLKKHFGKSNERQGSRGGASAKDLACQCKRHKRLSVRSLAREDSLEKGMVAHSGIFAWRITWIEESGGLQSLGSQRFGHD